MQEFDINEELIEEDVEESSDSYLHLVWQRFSRSKAAIVGGLMVVMLIVLAVFPEFFSPYDFYEAALGDSYTPPTQIRFFDLDGKFSFRPFVYKQELEIDPVTYQARPKIDPENRYNVRFFVRSWEYELFGFITTDIHLFGLDTDEVRLHLLGTDRFGRDLWGRICLAGRVSLSLSILAAVIAIVVGSSVGVISGYYGGAIDNVIQRFVEVIMSFPELPLWLALVAVIPKTWSGEQRFLMMVFIFPFLRWGGAGARGAGQGAFAARDGFHPGGEGAGRGRLPHYFQAPLPQHAEPCHRGFDADDPADNPGRGLPEFPGHRHTGTADELGLSDEERAKSGDTGAEHLDNDAGDIYCGGGAGSEFPGGWLARRG